MDMSLRNTTPDERYDDLETWMDALEDLGVDTGEALTEEIDLITRVNVLARHTKTHKQSSEVNVNGVARTILAGDINDYDQMINQANNAAFLVDEEQHARVQEILEATRTQAVIAVASRFRKRGDSVLELIRPIYDDLASRIIEAWALVPDGVTTLEEAARHDAHNAWVALQRMQEEWVNIHGLISAWFIAGVMSNEGTHAARDYQPAMFLVADFNAFKAEQVRPSSIARMGAGLTAGKPALRNICQVDASGIKFELATPTELSRAQRMERERAEEARRELASARPKKVRLDHQGRREMIAPKI
jgi:hypothetical protein